MRRYLPKNNTFIRNFSGRAHSAAHNINHGPGESIFKLCELVGSPISPGTRVARTLNGYQQMYERDKKHKKTKCYKESRCRKRRALFALYEKQQEETKYQKNMLLPVRPEKFRTDHAYTKLDKPKRV